MSSLPKLEEVLQSPIVQLLYCKFEEIYSHVKGLTSKLDFDREIGRQRVNYDSEEGLEGPSGSGVRLRQHASWQLSHLIIIQINHNITHGFYLMSISISENQVASRSTELELAVPL